MSYLVTWRSLPKSPMMPAASAASWKVLDREEGLRDAEVVRTREVVREGVVDGSRVGGVKLRSVLVRPVDESADADRADLPLRADGGVAVRAGLQFRPLSSKAYCA